MTARELIKARYTRIRSHLVTAHSSLHNFPPLEEVPEEEWDKDVAYLEEHRTGKSFVFCRLNTPQGPEEKVSSGTVEHLNALFEHLKEGVSVDELREATEAEIVDYVLGGGIEAEEDTLKLAECL